MATNIDTLWPRYIRPDVMSPSLILKVRAEALKTQTNGILYAEINSEEIDEGENIRLTFDIIVPLLDDYRHSILMVGHAKDFPYPAIVDAEVFRDDKSSFRVLLERGFIGAITGKPINRADNDEEFSALIDKVVWSSQVGTALQSLIARAKEALIENEQSDSPALLTPAEAPSSTPTSEIENSDRE